MKRIPRLFSGEMLVSAALALSVLPGCDLGSLTETIDTIVQRDISGIAMPGDPTKLTPVAFAPRATFGSANTAAALGYPGLSADGQALMNAEDVNSPLHFFITPHTDDEGVGPLFNQRRCLGCHFSSEDNNANSLMTGADPAKNPGAVFPAGAAGASFTTINVVNTPVSRAARQGPTDYRFIHDQYRPNTAAFTLFGDYFPASGAFDPISILGGPLQHVTSTSAPAGEAPDSCKSLTLPDLSHDPNLQGGIDPATGLSFLGARREVGERAGPPYIGRGLMEAIYFGDLVANDDLDDHVDATEPCVNGAAPAGVFNPDSTPVTSCSSLPPAVDHTFSGAMANGCPGDCVSGRHNEGVGSLSIVGGDPEVRVGRFGLRATGTTMLQFDVGGTQGEIGITSIFQPQEQPYPDGVGLHCDKAPDPETVAKTVTNLRAMIRLFAPPDYTDELRGKVSGQLATDVQAGAMLFGIDLKAFLSRTTVGMTPVGEEHGRATDRMLNCVACHIPIMKTGISPAAIDADKLSNKWAPIFSDLLVHQNPRYPEGFSYDNYEHSAERFIAQNYPYIKGNLSRNLSDFAIIPAVTGIASGPEFRTAPLMGIGKAGPPFLHDARVYVNTTRRLIETFPAARSGSPDFATKQDFAAQFPYDNPNPSRGVRNFIDPNAPTVAKPEAVPHFPGPIDDVATTVFTDSTISNEVRPIDSVDRAIMAAIELHDLPAPPKGTGGVGGFVVADYANCPNVGAALDLCRRDSRYRGEQRNTIEKWRMLTPAQQLQVVRFLESL